MKKINHPRPGKKYQFWWIPKGKQLKIMTVSNCSSNNPTSPEGGGGVSGLVWFLRLCWSCICRLFSDRSYRWHPLKMSHSEPKANGWFLGSTLVLQGVLWIVVSCNTTFLFESTERNEQRCHGEYHDFLIIQYWKTTEKQHRLIFFSSHLSFCSHTHSKDSMLKVGWPSPRSLDPCTCRVEEDVGITWTHTSIHQIYHPGCEVRAKCNSTLNELIRKITLSLHIYSVCKGLILCKFSI